MKQVCDKALFPSVKSRSSVLERDLLHLLPALRNRGKVFANHISAL
jgi:hypothetical protein